jgi:hypothetical protein
MPSNDYSGNQLKNVIYLFDVCAIFLCANKRFMEKLKLLYKVNYSQMVVYLSIKNKNKYIFV